MRLISSLLYYLRFHKNITKLFQLFTLKYVNSGSKSKTGIYSFIRGWGSYDFPVKLAVIWVAQPLHRAHLYTFHAQSLQLVLFTRFLGLPTMGPSLVGKDPSVGNSWQREKFPLFICQSRIIAHESTQRHIINSIIHYFSVLIRFL